MKLTACLTLITFLLSAGSLPARERVLQEWVFADAKDTLGWKVAEPLDLFDLDNGALAGRAAGQEKPKLESPLFDLPADASQFVEIEMRTNAGGNALVYYSNTTEEPYHGFRPELYTTFPVKGDGQPHTYTVFPFWQNQGKITHIRIDPPGTEFAIRAVRIISSKPDVAQSKPEWVFNGTTQSWRLVTMDGKAEMTPKGWQISGGVNTTVFSPPFDVSSDDHLWATIRATSKTAHTMLFRWAGSEFEGQQVIPIELRGDGLTHSYTIDLGEAADWNGRIHAVGLSPSESDGASEVSVAVVSISDKPTGPAELETTYFGLEQPFVRVGQKARAIVEVRNSGGADAHEVTALLTLRDESAPPYMPPRRIGVLKPGERVRFQWDIEVKKEADILAVCRVTGNNLDAGQKSIHIKVQPKLDPKSVQQGAVPKPAPADTGSYLVGSYYFPGWHTHDRWAVLDDYPERRPVLGYYSEGDPEVADWHINWALSHGISFFIYDWYWHDGARQLEHALHDGLFKSRYQDMMKFCLLWANHNPPSKSPEQDLIDVTKFWIDNYFKRPNYLKMGGKNVIVIFAPQRLRDDLGSAGVKSAFDKMRKLCEESGAGGLYLVACAYPGAGVKLACDEGYDALSGYNYPIANHKDRMRAPYEWMVEGYKDCWKQIADASTAPYIPVCEPGWDARPWHGAKSLVRTGKSPYLWQTMLENAKAFVDDPGRKLPADKKLVFLEAWNEFGEGDYIEPHEEFGFDYLEAVRSVFAPESKQPAIVVPQDVGLGPYDIARPEPVTAWDFSRKEDQTWTIGNMSEFGFEGGVMRAKAGGDPAFYSPKASIDASKVRTAEIRMKMDKGQEAQLFFSRARGKMAEDKSVRFPVKPGGDFQVYEIDLAANPRWKGTIGQLRLDPNSEEGSIVEVAYIRLK